MQFTMEYMRLEERKYAYHHSYSVNCGTGCIGCFHGNLNYNDGIGFQRYWDSLNGSLQTNEFEREFVALIQALKTEKDLGYILAGSRLMGNYCHIHKDARIEGPYRNIFGFRIETAKYLYLLRIDCRSEYEDFAIYAYAKQEFAEHLKRTANGITFSPDWGTQKAFTICDGDSICIQYPNGTHELKVCNYLSEDCVELNGAARYIKAFLAEMDYRNCQIRPVRKSLPPFCYFCNEAGQLMEVRAGQDAIVSPINSDDIERNKANAPKYNKKFVTPAQFKAMVHGATHSWADPEADPANYDEDGNLTL